MQGSLGCQVPSTFHGLDFSDFCWSVCRCGNSNWVFRERFSSLRTIRTPRSLSERLEQTEFVVNCCTKRFVVSTRFTQVPFVELSLWPDPQIQKVLVKTQRHTPLSTAHGAGVPEPTGQDNASNKRNPTAIFKRARLPLWKGGHKKIKRKTCEKDNSDP